MSIKLNLKRTVFKTFYNVFYTDGLMKKSDLGLEVRNTKWRKRDLQARDVSAWWCGAVVGGPSPRPGGIACKGDEWNESRPDNIRSHAVRREPAQGGSVQGVRGLRACGHSRARKWNRAIFRPIRAWCSAGGLHAGKLHHPRDRMATWHRNWLFFHCNFWNNNSAFFILNFLVKSMQHWR